MVHRESGRGSWRHFVQAIPPYMYKVWWSKAGDVVISRYARRLAFNLELSTLSPSVAITELDPDLSQTELLLEFS